MQICREFFSLQAAYVSNEEQVCYVENDADI